MGAAAHHGPHRLSYRPPGCPCNLNYVYPSWMRYKQGRALGAARTLLRRFRCFQHTTNGHGAFICPRSAISMIGQ